MDINEASRLYREELRAWGEDEKLIDDAQRRQIARRKLLDGLRGLYPEIAEQMKSLQVTSDVTEDRPKGKEAARVILLSDTERWWTVKDVVDEHEKRGWLSDSEDPESAIRQSLYRLDKSDPHALRRSMSGVLQFRYRVSPNGESQPVLEGAG